MVLLTKFWPIMPDPGLLFWTTIIFFLFWFLVGRFAFRPIADALKERERSIDEALASAKQAREEMSNLKAQNESILQEAREERSKMLKEAKDIRTKMISDAEKDAKERASKIISDAQVEIDNQKKSALADIKNQAGTMAIAIAEKVIQKELKGNPEQEAFVSTLVNDIKLN